MDLKNINPINNGADFGFLCNNEKFADIHFMVGRDRQECFPAHKTFLSAKSVVFEAMFFGSLRTNSDTIIVPDVEPASFLAMLKFIYSNEVHIDSETVMNTLYAARKYILLALEDHCVNFIKSILDGDNVFLWLMQADVYQKPELTSLCLETIDINATDAFASDYFAEIDLDNLIRILERSTLQIFESKLFEAIITWSKAECERKKLPVIAENQRSVLGRALKLINFSLMTHKEFVKGPFQSNLLAKDEVDKVCIELAPKTNMSEIPRCSDLQHFEVRLTILQSFTVQRTYFVVGFLVKQIGNDGYDTKYNLQHNTVITLIDEKVDTPIHYNISQPTNYNFWIMCKRPIMIIPNKLYRIEIRVAETVVQGEISCVISEMIVYRK